MQVLRFQARRQTITSSQSSIQRIDTSAPLQQDLQQNRQSLERKSEMVEPRDIDRPLEFEIRPK